MPDRKLSELDVAIIEDLLEKHKQANPCTCSFTTEEVILIKLFLKSFGEAKTQIRQLLIASGLFAVGFIVYLIYASQRGGIK